MNVRAEQSRDHAAVRAVNTAAFDTDAEARLVDTLRQQANPITSLVAEDGQGVIGHILFTPVTVDGHPELQIMGLAPMAVVPERQRGGVGAALVREGLARCRSLGAGAVVVLGHPAYYPRFGFAPAIGQSLTCEFEAPPEAFLVIELVPGYLDGVSGTVRYHPAFRQS